MRIEDLFFALVRIVVAVLQMGFAAPWAFILVISVVMDWFDRIRTTWTSPDTRGSVLKEAGDDIISIITLTFAHALQPGWWMWAAGYTTWKLVRIKRPFWAAEARRTWLGEFSDDLSKWAPMLFGIVLFFGGVATSVTQQAVGRFLGEYPISQDTFGSLTRIIALVFTAPFSFFLIMAAVLETHEKATEAYADGGASHYYLAVMDNVMAVIVGVIMLIGSGWTILAALVWLVWKSTYMETFIDQFEPWSVAISEDARIAATVLMSILLLYNVFTGGDLSDLMIRYWQYLMSGGSLGVNIPTPVWPTGPVWEGGNSQPVPTPPLMPIPTLTLP